MPITGRPPKSLTERFTERFRIDPSGCWIWTGTIDSRGYGVIIERFGVYTKQQQKAHRVSYRLHIGPIPEGHDVHHECHTKLCVNPAHLKAIPDGEHSLLHGWCAKNVIKTHCIHGHPFNESNTYPRHLKNGRVARGCIECRRLHNRNEYYKRKAKQA